MKGLRSNSDIFADRGDPWVSEKEGLKDYGRFIRSENPEFDSYFTKKAPVKVEPKSETRTERTNDYAKRLANAARKTNREMAAARKSSLTRRAK